MVDAGTTSWSSTRRKCQNLLFWLKVWLSRGEVAEQKLMFICLFLSLPTSGLKGPKNPSVGTESSQCLPRCAGSMLRQPLSWNTLSGSAWIGKPRFGMIIAPFFPLGGRFGKVPPKSVGIPLQVQILEPKVLSLGVQSSAFFY